MFVAVIPYKHRSAFTDNELLVFDTDDLSVEWVKKDDIEDNSIPVRFGGISDEPMIHVPERILAQGITYRLPLMHEGAFIVNDYSTVILDYKVSVSFSIHDTKDILYINGTEIVRCKGVDLSYVFRYKGVYIMRMLCTIKNFRKVDLVSAVVDDKGDVIAYWDSEFKVVSNKELATRIDTLMEY